MPSLPPCIETEVVSVWEKRDIHSLWVTYNVVMLSEQFVILGSVLSTAVTKQNM